jgi:ParB-like chromosome segregation protein Spo0J
MPVITTDPKRLETAPPFENLFPVDEQVLAQIVTSMRKDGYHRTKPIKAWLDAFATPGRLVVVDGHTRLAAARRAKIAEVTVDARHYASVNEAYLDAVREQSARRNLSRGEAAVFAVKSIKALREQGGRQPTTKQLASALNVSTATVDRARQLVDRGSDELIERVLHKGTSLLDAYEEVRRGEAASPATPRTGPEASNDARPRPRTETRSRPAAGKDPVSGAADGYRTRLAEHPNPEAYRALVETMLAAEDDRDGTGYELDLAAASELAYALLRADREPDDVLDGAPAPKKRGSETRSRMHRVARERAAAKRANAPIAFWDTRFELSKCIGFLEAIEVDELELDEYTVDKIEELYDDMARLQVFQNRVRGATLARLDEQKVRLKIRALRAKTVEAGCSPEEAQLAQEKADVIERQMDARLEAGGVL